MACRFYCYTRRILLVMIFIQNCFLLCTTFGFDHNYFGVILETDVHHIPEGSTTLANPQDLYSFQTMRTMLTVITGKFSEIFVSDQLAATDAYIQNFTYLKNSRLAVFAGEAAAIINQRAGTKNVTLMYNLHSQESAERMETSVKLAFESTERANQRFPGTVEGICFPWKSQGAHQTVTHLRFYREKASRLGIKLGARLLRTEINHHEKITVTVQEIVRASDFIVFEIMPSEQTLEFGAVSSFGSMERELLLIRNVVREINPNAEVIANTQWPGSKMENYWEYMESLKIFWETSSKWAAEHKYKIYQWEAFDHPWRAAAYPKLAHRGWWKLSDNSKINHVNGYIEKISELSVGNSSQVSSTTNINMEPTRGDMGNVSTVHSDSPGVAENEDKNTTSFSPVIWNEVTIAITAIGSVLVVLVSVLLVFLVCRHQRKTRTCTVAVVSENDVRDFILGTSREASKGSITMTDVIMTVPYDVSLEIPKDKLKIDAEQVLGSGQFGCVYKALVEWSEGDTSKVAVKVAKRNCTSMALKGLLSEIKILSYLGKHDNIVALKGAYTAELINGIVYVATELCGLGSLENFLRTQAKYEFRNHTTVLNEEGVEEIELCTMSTISYSDMVRWAYEMASGMQYLERKHVVHADLAARNVLLTSNRTAKISDFGLSRRMYNYMNYVKMNQEPLPWRWMAVESLKRFEFSSKSDVWSYAVTLWEIFSKGDVPYPGLSWTQDFVNRLQDGLRPECPKFSSSEIYAIMQACWNLNPKERPNFGHLTDSFDDLIRECPASPSRGNLYE